MSHPGMRDVAAAAGVSIATVSHVINGTRYVAPETRDRVLDCIRRLHYQPNQMARVFKTGRKQLIGFIVPDIANLFFSRLIEEIESVIAQEGYRLLVSNTREDQQNEAESIRTLASGVVDGLIIASTMEHYSQLAALLPDGFPCVFIDRSLPGCPADMLTISNEKAMYEAVECLIEEGHTRIGFITGLPRLSTTQERLQAYRTAMSDHQLDVEAAFICEGTSMHSGMEKHIRQLAQAQCTAIIVSNHLMTEEALFCLQEEGLTGQMTLVGYHDSSYPNYGLRQIHAVSQPTDELGRRAGGMMLQRLRQPDAPQQRMVLQAAFTKAVKP